MIVFCKYNLYNDTKNPNGCTLLMLFPYAVVSAGNNLAEHDAVIVRNIFPFTGWYSGERHNGENSGLRCKDTVFYGPTYRWFRFFIWACRRGGAESRYIRIRHQMPPRRRAFRSNDFGLEPTTIPRDAKRQAEPPSRRERIPAKIISTAIPHAGSSNPTPVSRRTTHTLVSTFSRAAIVIKRAAHPQTALRLVWGY